MLKRTWNIYQCQVSINKRWMGGNKCWSNNTPQLTWHWTSWSCNWDKKITLLTSKIWVVGRNLPSLVEFEEGFQESRKLSTKHSFLICRAVKLKIFPWACLFEWSFILSPTLPIFIQFIIFISCCQTKIHQRSNNQKINKIWRKFAMKSLV